MASLVALPVIDKHCTIVEFLVALTVTVTFQYCLSSLEAALMVTSLIKVPGYVRESLMITNGSFVFILHRNTAFPSLGRSVTEAGSSKISGMERGRRVEKGRRWKLGGGMGREEGGGERGRVVGAYMNYRHITCSAMQCLWDAFNHDVSRIPQW